MKPIRGLSRRSFLARIGGGIALGGSLSGCVGFGYSDSDPYDPVGYGRGDYGRGRRGGGRGGRRGRGRGGCSDSDGGPYADPGGRGRHC